MPTPTAPPSTLEVWFLTGSQDLYGEDDPAQVAAQSQEIADALNASATSRCKLVWKPVLTDSDAIRRAALDANADDAVIGVIAWMHTFSPAKMWIAGLDALRKPLLHLHTQANVELPWADIDFDFMNLNQAAHGDREFGYIQTRLGVPRKTVVGHVSNPAVVASDRRLGARLPPAGPPCAPSSSPGSATTCATSRSPRATRPRPSCASASRSTPGASTTSPRPCTAPPRPTSTPSSPSTSELYDVVPELRSGGDRHESLRYGARDRARPAVASSRPAASAAFTTNFEDLGALRQLPGLAVQRLMADGYGFGAEGDWKTAILVRAAKVMGAGLPGGASLMEDYTYDLTPGAGEDPRRAHARGLPVPDRRRSRASRSTRSASAARRTRSAWSSTPTPAPASSSRCPTCATASASWPTSSTSSTSPSRCPTCPSPAPSGSRKPDFAHLRRRLADRRAPRTTPC